MNTKLFFASLYPCSVCKQYVVRNLLARKFSNQISLIHMKKLLLWKNLVWFRYKHPYGNQIIYQSLFPVWCITLFLALCVIHLASVSLTIVQDMRVDLFLYRIWISPFLISLYPSSSISHIYSWKLAPKVIIPSCTWGENFKF